MDTIPKQPNIDKKTDMHNGISAYPFLFDILFIAYIEIKINLWYNYNILHEWK